jgi:uncharacterized membrane protein YccC
VKTKDAGEAPGPPWHERRRAELRLGVRMVVAALVSFTVARALALPQAYWAVLTSIIVMQSSVGGSIKATVDRMVGTFAGAMWGALVSMAVPHAAGGSAAPLGPAAWSFAAALALTVGPLAVLAAVRPAFRVAPVTAVIVLLGQTSQRLGPLVSAFDRVLDIGLGCLVALLVALFVLPARAHRLLAEAAARAVEPMAELIAPLADRLGAPADALETRERHDRVRDAVARAEAVADEAARERASRLTEAPDPDPLVRTLRRLRHDLIMVSRATAEPLPDPARGVLVPAAARAAEEVGAFLRASAAALERAAPPPPLDAVAAALDAYAAAMGEIRSRRLTRELPVDAVGQLFGLAFALDELRGNLSDLADRVRELAPPRGAASGKS